MKVKEFIDWRLRSLASHMARLRQPRPGASVERILCVVNGGIGDRLMVLPAIRFLKRQYSAARLCVAWYDDGLPIDDPAIDEHITISSKSYSEKYRVARRGWDLVFVNSIGVFDPFTEMMALLCGAHIRIGPAHAHQRRTAYTHPFPIGVAHETVVNARGAGWSGDEAALPSPIIGMLRGTSRQASDEPPDRIILHVTCKVGYEAKRWPIGRFRQLIEILSSQTDARFKFIGHSSERQFLEDAAQGVARATVETFGDFSAMAEAIAAAKLFIGNDSGPAHVAAALEVPTITIMAPTNPALCAPVSENGVVVSEPCAAGFCYYNGRPCVRCIDAITADRVAATALRLLETEQAKCPMNS